MKKQFLNLGYVVTKKDVLCVHLYCLWARILGLVQMLFCTLLGSSCIKFTNTAVVVLVSLLTLQAQSAPSLGVPNNWVLTSWNELPGWHEESSAQVWRALLASCEKAQGSYVVFCALLRASNATNEDEQRLFLMTQLQPFRILSTSGEPSGLLTGYYEPVFAASRNKQPGFEVPIYAPTQEILNLRKNNLRWYSRQEIDTSPLVQEALKGKEIAWLADPLDALALQIQGSGKLLISAPDGAKNWVKVVYAASNELAYQSIGKTLLDKAEITDASWAGIRAWATKNPDRLKTLIWSNPRYVFFRQEPVVDPLMGPKGAQGLPLMAGRSVAVDPSSIPYGTPLWLVSEGPLLNLHKCVIAQDTGNAITGTVRADYFVGTGAEAGEIAGHLKQSLNLWALVPR
jgi:membrane-bound lytic murein transglycosylase A